MFCLVLSQSENFKNQLEPASLHSKTSSIPNLMYAIYSTGFIEARYHSKHSPVEELLSYKSTKNGVQLLKF